MDDGWYLMSPRDLEQELKQWRDPGDQPLSSNSQSLSVEDALTYRNSGNLPDDLGRTLRLVINIPAGAEPGYVDQRRLELEPDFHDAPTWRREGSKPVNVVPLRAPGEKPSLDSWLDDPAMEALEREWRARGTVAGMKVPGEYRSFVYKTIVSLRAAGREVTARSVSDSISRWLEPQDAQALRAALEEE